MSLAGLLTRSVAPAFNAVHADVWVILGGPDAGKTFQADAQTEPPIILDSEISSDSREKTVLYLERPIPRLNSGIRIGGLGATWSIVGSVDDNPANDRVKFEIMKIVDGKDT